MAYHSFSQRVLTWFDQHGRHDLPWQHNTTPYRVWVSEIMLQQTQVATVIPYYTAFMKQFPTLKSLALASQDAVMSQWSGLGYYSRARHLHRCAQQLHQHHGGRFPNHVDELMKLPGIGRSTAGAILSLSKNHHAPILDGNVKRVLARHFAVPGWPGQQAVLNALWSLSETHTPQERCGPYNQAMMDLGATVCTRTQPRCTQCPVNKTCTAYADDQIDQFPGKKPKASHRRREETLLLMIHNHQGSLLLEKRPNTGIWGGLWCFPECNTLDDINAHCTNMLNVAVRTVTPQPQFKHVFSHYDLYITPVVIHLHQHNIAIDDGRQVWYTLSQPLPGGIAKPTQQLLQQRTKELA